jgi:hypothetical protein
MEHREPLSSNSPWRPAALPTDPEDLAILARRGVASALAALRGLCHEGPPEQRAAALRAVPGLLPYQPVWPILHALDRPDTPAPVRQALDAVRILCEDPRRHERAFRAAQRRLCQDFADAEAARAGVRRDHPGPRTAAAIAGAFYDYRFAWADGCIGHPEARHLEEFLLKYAPRHLFLEPPYRARAPQVLGRHIGWLCQVGRLLPADAHGLARRCLLSRGAYREAIAPRAQPGSLRAILAEAQAAGVDLTDEQALGRHVELSRLDLDEEFAPVWLL